MRDELDDDFDEKIDRTAVDAARRKFSPDKVIVFKTLSFEHLRQILDIEFERGAAARLELTWYEQICL